MRYTVSALTSGNNSTGSVEVRRISERKVDCVPSIALYTWTGCPWQISRRSGVVVAREDQVRCKNPDWLTDLSWVWGQLVLVLRQMSGILEV